MNTTIKRVTIPEGKRIIAISDIHGNDTYLKKLLAQIGFSKEDILFIVGDLIDKGPESLKTLRYIMELEREYTVMVSCGNVDYYRVWLTAGEEDTAASELKKHVLFMKDHWGGGLYYDMLKELGIDIKEDCDWLECLRQVRRQYKKELDYVKGLPAIIETEKIVFVHGGLPDLKGEGRGVRLKVSEILNAAKEQDAIRFMKLDAFYELGFSYDRYLVVGHWPTVLYHRQIPCSNPIIDLERKIISIDGGCSIKSDGQLNALIIDDISACNFSYESYYAYPTARALENQLPSRESVYIPWVDNRIRLLESLYTEGAAPEKKEYIWVEHVSTGRRLKLLTQNLYRVEENGVDAVCTDYTDYELSVDAGDELGLLKRASDGYIVKKGGITGWYRGKLSLPDSTWDQ